jgi:hypothetical protein
MTVPQRRSAATASISAPLGGWNARDSLAEMSPLDAVTLENWFPTPSDVTLRKGYTKHCTGLPAAQADSLMNYAGSTGQKLFAAVNAVIYEVTTSTPVSQVTGLGSDRFQHINISTAGGQFLVACNGVDPVQVYNGTYWFSIATTGTGQTISTITRGGTGNLTATLTTASAHGLVTGNQVVITGATESNYNGTYKITVTGSTTFTYTMATAPSANATVVGTYTPVGITGVNSNTFINVNLYKERLWFTQEDSMKVWYLPVDSIAGAASEINFGGIARMGGFLQAMGTWTLDAGQGVDDYAVFVTNMGEVMVYAGLDPSDPNNWALRGVWQLGQTFTRRCFFKWSGDLLLLTKDGLTPLASALQSSRLDPRVNLTDKIYFAISQAASLFSTQFGWQINYLAEANMLLINIPTSTGWEQYVMHSITKSWAKFTGINASCFEIHNDKLYFGGNGYIGKYYDSFADDGQNITGYVQQAYNYFESRGQQKRFTMVRPIFLTNNGYPTVLAGVNVDFDVQNQLGSVTFNPVGDFGIWDATDWDDCVWGGGGLTVSKIWQGVTGLGYAAGIALSIASQGIEVHWASTDFVMERGGVI